MTCVVIDFDAWKTRPCERAPVKPVVVKQGKPKKPEELYVRRAKAAEFLGSINSMYWHKFSYPMLACRYPKSVHSFDVLAGHIFSTWGRILEDDDFPTLQPGIWFAKQEAYAREDEITAFLAWRLRKYHECASYYGYDIKIIESAIENTHNWHNLFQKFFLYYYATKSRNRTVHAV